jgi:hypothetical protein
MALKVGIPIGFTSEAELDIDLADVASTNTFCIEIRLGAIQLQNER